MSLQLYLNGARARQELVALDDADCEARQVELRALAQNRWQLGRLAAHQRAVRLLAT